MINEYNHDLYKTDWRWYEDGYEVTRTSVWTGPGCHNGCGVLTYVKDGKLEKIEGVVAQVKRALAILQEQEEKATASFQKEGGALKAALAKLEAERAALAAVLPGELADAYERAARHCGGVAVAILNGSACGACRVPIDAGRLAAIKREAPLSTCPHCKRMLVVAG